MCLAAIGQYSRSACDSRKAFLSMDFTACTDTSARPLALGSSPAVLVVMMPLPSAQAWNFPQNSFPLSEWILVR